MEHHRYICRLFSHNVVSLNNKMAAMLVSHNLAGNKTFCHVNTSFYPNWFERVVKTLAIHPKIRCNCTTVQSVCPCKPNECESSHICRHKNGTKNAIMSQSDVCHSCQSQLTAVKMGHLPTCITNDGIACSGPQSIKAMTWTIEEGLKKGLFIVESALSLFG